MFELRPGTPDEAASRNKLLEGMRRGKGKEKGEGRERGTRKEEKVFILVPYLLGSSVTCPETPDKNTNSGIFCFLFLKISFVKYFTILLLFNKIYIMLLSLFPKYLYSKNYYFILSPFMYSQ